VLRFLTDPDFLLPRFRRIARLRVVAFIVAGAFVVATGLHLYDLADVVAQRAIPAGRLAELDRELSQQVLLLEVAAGFGDLVAQCFRQREMLKKCDDVGESFMEGEYVGVGGLAEAPVQAVKQRVCRLMGHDVVGRRRENDSSGQRGSRIRVGSGEIAEQEGLTLRAVIRILGAQGVRIDSKPLHVFVMPFAIHRLLAWGPQRDAAERVLEMFDRLHRHCIRHLLMKLRTGFRR
jgi:hypothetical protein